MSLFADALLVVGGILLGRLVARSLRSAGARTKGDPRKAYGTTAGGEADPFERFPCKLGDVVLRRRERDEAWLAGALVFHEAQPAAVLFVAPQARGDRALYVHDGVLTWLAPLTPRPDVPDGEPPFALELEGTTFERTRRLPVRVEGLGAGWPDVGERAVIAEYEGPGDDRVLLLRGSIATLAWRGEALLDGDYEVLPGGHETLRA